MDAPLDGHPDSHRVGADHGVGRQGSCGCTMWEDVKGHLSRYYVRREPSPDVPHDCVTDDEYAFPHGRRMNCIRTSGPTSMVTPTGPRVGAEYGVG